MQSINNDKNLPFTAKKQRNKADGKHHKHITKPLIGITMGDVNGIGIELIIKIFSDARMLDYCTPVIYGSSRILSYYRKVLKAENFTYNVINSIERAKTGTCNVLNCWTEEVPINIGKARPEVGKYALRALESTVYDLTEGKLAAMVTAPVNKSLINTAILTFIGHTEYITQKFDDAESLMFLVSDNLKVGLVTNHVPVQEVEEHIDKERILQKLQLMYQSLERDFGVNRPKIAVLSLNPHAGDGGLLGKADDEIIKPLVERENKKGMPVYGPYAADGFFGAGLYKQFDGVLAMYHDQGLIPFKLLSFGEGVNFTAGLPIVRTSPDHGTAYDLVGKNIASPDSFRRAIFLAMDIVKKRTEYDELTANPLQKNLINDPTFRGH